MFRQPRREFADGADNRHKGVAGDFAAHILPDKPVEPDHKNDGLLQHVGMPEFDVSVEQRGLFEQNCRSLVVNAQIHAQTRFPLISPLL